MSAAVLRTEAAAAERLASRIEAEARALPDLLDGVAARRGADVWRGPAADDFAAELRRWRNRLDSEAGMLVGVARRLRTRAEQLRAEAYRVAAAEAAAERERAATPARTATGIG